MSCDQDSAPDLLPGQAASRPLTFRMWILGDPRLLSVVRSAVSEFAAACGFDTEQCRSITLALGEALCNVIRHAYKDQWDQEIQLDCEARSDYLEFTLADRGEPADLSRICAQPLDEVALGGRGTHLIRQIMDEVCCERVGEVNQLRLKKYLPGAKCNA